MRTIKSAELERLRRENGLLRQKVHRLEREAAGMRPVVSRGQTPENLGFHALRGHAGRFLAGPGPGERHGPDAGPGRNRPLATLAVPD